MDDEARPHEADPGRDEPGLPTSDDLDSMEADLDEVDAELARLDLEDH